MPLKFYAGKAAVSLPSLKRKNFVMNGIIVAINSDRASYTRLQSTGGTGFPACAGAG
jgi:hypothetical protein